MPIALNVVGLVLAACGGGGGGGASCTPHATSAIVLTSTGTTPTNACVLPAGTVTFTNNDTAPHDIEFGAAGCPVLGPITPGGGQVTGTFPTPGSCVYHDADNPTNTAFQGTVAVTNSNVGGGGY
jgi:hypothetical protein